MNQDFNWGWLYGRTILKVEAEYYDDKIVIQFDDGTALIIDKPENIEFEY